MYNLREEAKSLSGLPQALEKYEKQAGQKLGGFLKQYRMPQSKLNKCFSFPSDSLNMLARYFYYDLCGQNETDACTMLEQWVRSVAGSVERIMTAGQNTEYKNGTQTVLNQNYSIPPFDRALSAAQIMRDAVSAGPLPVYGADSYPRILLHANGYVQAVEAEETLSAETENFWKVQLFRLCQLDHQDQNTKYDIQKDRIRAACMVMLWYAEKLRENPPAAGTPTEILFPVTRERLKKSISSKLSDDKQFDAWISDFQEMIRFEMTDDHYGIAVHFANPETVHLPEKWSKPLYDLRKLDTGQRIAAKT